MQTESSKIYLWLIVRELSMQAKIVEQFIAML